MRSIPVRMSQILEVFGACRELLSTSFTNSRVEFTRRQAYAAAQALAREATSLTSPNI